MIVRELIAKLEKMPQDLPVRIYADHGQQAQKIGSVTQFLNAEPDEYGAESLYSSMREAEEEGWTKREIAKFERYVEIS